MSTEPAPTNAAESPDAAPVADAPAPIDHAAAGIDAIGAALEAGGLDQTEQGAEGHEADGQEAIENTINPPAESDPTKDAAADDTESNPASAPDTTTGETTKDQPKPDPKAAAEEKAAGAADDFGKGFVEKMRSEFDDDVGNAVQTFVDGIKPQVQAAIKEAIQEFAQAIAPGLNPDAMKAALPINGHIDSVYAKADPKAAALYGKDWMSATSEQRAARAALETKGIELSKRPDLRGKSEADIIRLAHAEVAKSKPGREAKVEVINRAAASRSAARVPVPVRAGGTGGGGGGGGKPGAPNHAQKGADAIERVLTMR